MKPKQKKRGCCQTTTTVLARLGRGGVIRKTETGWQWKNGDRIGTPLVESILDRPNIETLETQKGTYVLHRKRREAMIVADAKPEE